MDRKIDDDTKGFTPERCQMLRKEGRSRLTSIDDGVDVIILGVDEYTKRKNKKQIMITAASNDIIIRNNKRINSKMQKKEEKQVDGFYERQTNKIA